MRYLVLGAGGMAGHMITNYLIEQGEEVAGLARKELHYCKTHVMDAANFESLKELVQTGNYDIVINCIGLLNQDAEQNIAKAIQLNSYLPHFLTDITKNKKTRIFQMSTDCVFSGKRGQYQEKDNPDGETYYDKTKALGEIKDNKNLTFRNSIIGPDMNENGIGLFHWFMKQSGKINGFVKSRWTGVTTLTLAKAFHKASYSNLTGLYHLVNNEVTTKYDLLCLFNKYSGKNLKIKKVDGIMHDKSLVNTRTDFDFKIPSYEQQIEEMMDWIKTHNKMYHYILQGGAKLIRVLFHRKACAFL